MKIKLTSILLTLLFLCACSNMPSKKVETPQFETGEIATFAGGCFWCMEPAFEAAEGVLDVVVGYAGGSEENAKYSSVSSGNTKHREAAQVNFDPEKISYEELIEIFWQQIDPTDPGGQFADRGFHYTTAIYYHNKEQKNLAEQAIKNLEESGKFDEPIATIAAPYTTFFLAEEFHQNFYKNSSEKYERYKKGSGRADFIEENWAKEEALRLSR